MLENNQSDAHWWTKEYEKLLTIAKTQSPCYVYHRPTQIIKTQALFALNSIDQIYYAIKANSHPTILKTLYEQGVSFECVSIHELQHILTIFPQIEKQRLLFTPNFAAKKEYEFALALGCYVTVDNLYPLEQWTSLFKKQRILLRFDPGHGAGHHKYVHTAGNESKFGIHQADAMKAAQLVKQNQIQVIGLHAHSGSGILVPELWQQTATTLINLSNYFPDVKIINLGGGLGIPEKEDQPSLDLSALDQLLMSVKSHFPQLSFWLEPGRFFTAESGVILAKVTQCKQKDKIYFIGIETGMNSLLRPALYEAYHEIVNLSRLHEEKTLIAHIVGPICESGDTLGYHRLLPKTYEDDVLLIANTGAYGYCMSSHYNLRPPAQEIILD